MARSLRIDDTVTFSIIGSNGKIAGYIRVKPNGVAWCPPGQGAHKWRSVTIKQFAEFAEREGERKDK